MTTVPPDERLGLLAAGLERGRGENFFPVVAELLARLLGAREALACEAAPARRARTLAVWRAGGPAPNYEYGIDGTPCARVYAGESVTLAARDACANESTYFGVPLAAKDGAVLGHLCAWLEPGATLDDGQRAASGILADRAAAELRLVHVKRERALLRAQRRQLRAEVAAAHDVGAIIGISAAHRRVMDEARRLAVAQGAVLLSGEPGTGKELIARAIHAASERANRPFTRFDCAAAGLAGGSELLQLFGLTSGGTVFLDHVARLPAALQEELAALLAAGPPDARLMAATAVDLRQAARDGAFSEALLQHLTTFTIDLPPLRARVDDIQPLLQHYAHLHARRLGTRMDGIDPDSMAALLRYSWPGNVRELMGVVERALLLQQGSILKVPVELMVGSPAERAALIAAAAAETTGARALFSGTDFDDTLNTGLHDVQREHILRVLNATHWVIEGNSGAALRLGLKPATLRHRMKKLGITRARQMTAAEGT